MTMIEHVAKALEQSDVGYNIQLSRLVDGVSSYRLTMAGNVYEFDSYEDAADFAHAQRLKAHARAAIEAMREPDAGMEDAAFRAAQDTTAHTNGEFSADRSVWPLFIRSKVLWQAMIKAALSEKDG